MTISQISAKYRISEAYLNSKDDALLIIGESLKELKTKSTDQTTLEQFQKLIDFCHDVKNSNY